MPNQTTQGVGHQTHHCFTPWLQRGAFLIEVWMIFKDLQAICLFQFITVPPSTNLYKRASLAGSDGVWPAKAQGPHFLMRFSVFSKFVNPHPEVGRAQST